MRAARILTPKNILLYILLLATATYFLSNFPVSVEGIGLELSGSTLNDGYMIFYSSVYVDDPDYRIVYHSKDPDRFAVFLDIPNKAKNRPYVIRPGHRQQEVELTALIFCKKLLGLPYPLLRISGRDLAAYIRPCPENTRLIPTQKGIRLRSARGWGPEATFDFHEDKILASVSPSARMGYHLVWGLLFVVSLLVILVVTRIRYGFLQEILHNIFITPTNWKEQRSMHRKSLRLVLPAILLLLLVVVPRSWDNFTHPGLYVEDSTQHFNLFYGNTQKITKIFERPHNYMAVGTHLIGWLTARLDVRIQPTVYLAVAIGMSLLTSLLFSFSGLLRNNISILLAPVVLGTSGIIHVYMWNTLTYQIFVAAIMLLLLLLYPPPEHLLSLILYLVFVPLLIWSAPYSVLAIPLAAGLLLLRVFPCRQKTLLLLYTIVITFCYFLTLKSGTSRPLQLFTNPLFMQHFTTTLFENIFFLDLFGKMSQAKIMIFLFCLGSCFVLFRKDPLYLKISTLFLLVIVVNLFLYFSSKKYMNYEHWPNHLQISLFFWYCFLIFSLDRMTILLRRNRPPLLLLGWTLLLGICLADNLAHPDKYRVPVMPKIPEFLDTVKKWEEHRQELLAANEYVIIQSDAYWRHFEKNFGPLVRIGSREKTSRPRAWIVISSLPPDKNGKND